MNKAEIVEKLAQERVVENLARVICKVSNNYLDDLSQMVYVYLLEYDEEKIVTLYEEGSLRFFLVRIIKNQWYSHTSPFHYTYRRLLHRTCDIADYEIED